MRLAIPVNLVGNMAHQTSVTYWPDNHAKTGFAALRRFNYLGIVNAIQCAAFKSVLEIIKAAHDRIDLWRNICSDGRSMLTSLSTLAIPESAITRLFRTSTLVFQHLVRSPKIVRLIAPDRCLSPLIPIHQLLRFVPSRFQPTLAVLRYQRTFGNDAMNANLHQGSLTEHDHQAFTCQQITHTTHSHELQ